MDYGLPMEISKSCDKHMTMIALNIQKMITNPEVNKNECCSCSGTYDKDVEKGNCREWHNSTCGHWLYNVCQVQLIWRKMLKYVQSVGLLKMPNSSMSLAEYFTPLFKLLCMAIAESCGQQFSMQRW